MFLPQNRPNKVAAERVVQLSDQLLLLQRECWVAVGRWVVLGRDAAVAAAWECSTGRGRVGMEMLMKWRCCTKSWDSALFKKFPPWTDSICKLFGLRLAELARVVLGRLGLNQRGSRHSFQHNGLAGSHGRGRESFYNF